MTLHGTLEHLEAGIAEGLHSGGQLTVVHDGRTVAELAFGEARPGEPMTTEHLMLWLSVTKPVVAVAIARLWEQGALDIELPVATWIPEFAEGGKEGVTVRHLLTHTAGIRALDIGFPELPWAAIIDRICSRKLEPRWRPGAKAGYHLASSWFILGELIRRLDGRHPRDYVRQEIFEPLAMDDCWLGIPAERYDELRPRLAPVYDSGGDGEPHPWTERSFATRCSPAGGGFGPVAQLARFWRMLLAGGELDGVRLLTPQTVAALTARHRVGLLDHTFRFPLDWGLGVIVNSAWHGDGPVPYGFGPHASSRTFGHGGDRSSVAFADPEAGVVVACVVNGTPSAAAHQQRFDRVTAQVYADLGIAAPDDP